MSSNSPDFRREHARMLLSQQRAMNGERRNLSDEVYAAIIRLCPKEKYDIGCHIAVQREIDRIWARYNGTVPNDPRALYLPVITGQTRKAYARVWQLSQGIITRHLSRFAPDLLPILKERARVKDEQQRR